MQITADQTSVGSLAAFGAQATILLCAGQISQLAEQYGYALAHSREPSLAIQEELAASLSQLGASSVLEPPAAPPRVSYFKPNDTGLFALIEQHIPTDNGKHVLLELIVTGSGPQKFVTLEQVSAVA